MHFDRNSMAIIFEKPTKSRHPCIFSQNQDHIQNPCEKLHATDMNSDFCRLVRFGPFFVTIHSKVNTDVRKIWSENRNKPGWRKMPFDKAEHILQDALFLFLPTFNMVGKIDRKHWIMCFLANCDKDDHTICSNATFGAWISIKIINQVYNSFIWSFLWWMFLHSVLFWWRKIVKWDYRFFLDIRWTTRE